MFFNPIRIAPGNEELGIRKCLTFDINVMLALPDVPEINVGYILILILIWRIYWIREATSILVVQVFRGGVSPKLTAKRAREAIILACIL